MGIGSGSLGESLEEESLEDDDERFEDWWLTWFWLFPFVWLLVV